MSEQNLQSASHSGNASNYITPSQAGQIQEAVGSMTKLLMEIPNSLITLRREFRGEALWQDDDGNNHWVQVSKPVFVKTNFATNKPITKKEKMPWSEVKIVYEPNDEAIDEILSILKFMGVNQIAPLGFNPANNYLDDLYRFESKLAWLLALKQKEWGLDKELLPMIQTKISTFIQDARSLALEGKTLKAIQTTVQRVEQMWEGQNKSSFREKMSPYG